MKFRKISVLAFLGVLAAQTSYSEDIIRCSFNIPKGDGPSARTNISGKFRYFTTEKHDLLWELTAANLHEQGKNEEYKPAEYSEQTVEMSTADGPDSPLRFIKEQATSGILATKVPGTKIPGLASEVTNIRVYNFVGNAKSGPGNISLFIMQFLKQDDSIVENWIGFPEIADLSEGALCTTE